MFFYSAENMKGPYDSTKTDYIRCREQSKQRCGARGTVKNGFLQLNSKTPHTCLSHWSMWAALEVRERLRRRAAEESTPLQDIHTQVLRLESPEVVSRLPFLDCKKEMEAARGTLLPKSPPDLETLVRNFEAGAYPTRFRECFLGHVSHKVRGKQFDCQVCMKQASTLISYVIILCDIYLNEASNLKFRISVFSPNINLLKRAIHFKI